MGDFDFVNVFVNVFIVFDYIDVCVKVINFYEILVIEDIKSGLKESEDIIYFFILDCWGNVVVNIIIINFIFGSGVVVFGVGFLFNDEMDDFSVKSGVFNFFGVVGGEVNVIVFYKCMFFFMIFILVKEGNDVVLVIGLLGGIMIIFLVI